MNLYVIRSTTKGPKESVYSADHNPELGRWEFSAKKPLDFWGEYTEFVSDTDHRIFDNPFDAWDYYEANTLAFISHLRSRADYLMANLRISHKMERRRTKDETQKEPPG